MDTIALTELQTMAGKQIGNRKGLDMTKKGFTLAEVLVTLGIIGIVAALTMPTLGRSASRAKIGPELSTAISTLENATQQFMNDYSANYLSVAMNKKGLDGRLSTYLNMLIEEGYIKGESGTFPADSEAYDGSTTPVEGGGTAKNGLVTTTSGLILANKSGLVPKVECSFRSIEEGAIGPDAPAMDKSDKCEVVFVTSGFQKRDTLVTGIDVFRVYLTNDGVVTTGESSACGEGTTGVDCAGRIAQDGWKVTY